jgi:hypothetical protein
LKNDVNVPSKSSKQKNGGKIIFAEVLNFTDEKSSRVSDPDPHGSALIVAWGVLYGGLGISKLQFLIKKI